MKKYLPLVRSFSMLMNTFHQLEDLFSNPRNFQPNKHSKNIKGKNLWYFQMLIFDQNIL
jgi:hypothetical protein